MCQTDFVKYLGQHYQILRQEYDQFLAEKKESFYLKAFDAPTRDKVKDDPTLHRFCSMELPVPGWRYDAICLEVNRDAGLRFYLCTCSTDLQDPRYAKQVIASESFRKLVFAISNGVHIRLIIRMLAIIACGNCHRRLSVCC